MNEQEPDDQQIDEQPLYELMIADYPLDAETGRTLVDRLVAELQQGERPAFQAGVDADVPMRALLVTGKEQDVFEVYCYAEAEPMGRVRIDMDLAQSVATVFVILTEEERDQVAMAAEQTPSPGA